MQDDRTYGGGTGAGSAGDAWSRSGSGSGTAGDASASSAGVVGERDREELDRLRERADEALGTAADTLDRAARKVDAFAELLPGQGVSARAGTLGHGAADTLESVARFLRDNDVETLQGDLGRLVSGRPVTTLLLAVGAGFVVGKVLR